MNEAIHRMTDRIVSVMDGKVNSIWIYGSIVLNDFQLGWSDIDFIALTENEITEKQARDLLMLRQSMLSDESDNQYYRSFEGIIANINECFTGNYTRLVYWGTSGQRITDSYSRDVFSSFQLSRYGRIVYGNADRSIFREPTRQEIVDAIKSHYETIRKYAQKTDERLYSCGWLLDIARCIYSLRYNDVISKTQAGIWALNVKLFEDEKPLQKALEIRKNPMASKNSEEIKTWLRELGPVVQQYADVLDKELSPYR